MIGSLRETAKGLMKVFELRSHRQTTTTACQQLVISAYEV